MLSIPMNPYLQMVQSARLSALEDENFATESHMQASDCAYVDEEEDEGRICQNKRVSVYLTSCFCSP